MAGYLALIFDLPASPRTPFSLKQSMNSSTPSQSLKPIEGRISSVITTFLKWFPVVWTGASLAIVSVGIGSVMKDPAIPWRVLTALACLLFLVVAAGGFVTAWFWRTSDEVSIRGNQLLVRKGNTRIAINKNESKNIQFTRWLNPPLATVELRSPTPLGDKLTFFAPLGTSSMRPSVKIQQIRNWLIAD